MTHDKQLIERLNAYATSLDALRQGVPMDDARKLASVTPALAAKAFAEAAQALSTLTAEVEARDRLIGVMADALDVADGIIAVNCGTGTPREWDCAFRSVQEARATLTKAEGTER